MVLALVVSQRSKYKNAFNQEGVILYSDERIVNTGYNGPPALGSVDPSVDKRLVEKYGDSIGMI